MMKPPAFVTIPASVLSQELTDEAILLNLDTETYFGLDDVGARLWQLFGQHSDVEQVITQMLAEYDVPEAQLRQDVMNLLEELAQASLVTIEAG